MKSRRDFLKLSASAGIGAMIAPAFISCSSEDSQVPAWIQDYASQYEAGPLQWARDWFSNAHFGMFIHYGLYSLLEKDEWVQFTEQIPVKEYEILKDRFTAEKFDADFITDLLLDSGMNYLNFVAKHHDSFCLWETGFSDFNSMNSPAGRDLLGEMSDQCNRKGIPLFITYSYGRDWRHAHAPDPDTYKSFSTRPAYKDTEPSYRYGDDHNLDQYIEYAMNQVRELLTNYGDIAGIWLGGASTILSGPIEPFRLPELYDMIRKAQPHCLVSNGTGVTGKEDYIAMLRKLRESSWNDKIIEICDTLQPFGWGYHKEADGKHREKEWVVEKLKSTCDSGCNLLLNTGPLPEGKIHPEDINTLKEVGKYIRKNGILV